MRPIKFRGRNIETGEYVFGDLRIIGIRPHIFKEAQCYYDEELIEVEPESVAQLVGYDAKNKEVYEGDTLIDKYKTLFGDSKSTFVAELWSRVKNPANGVYKFEINQLALKEDDQ